jgi:type IV pilus assembly protein PilN
MIRINLLPHREQKRQARQRQFISLAVVVAVLGVAVYGLGHVILQAQIENQDDRNKLLKAEIAKLDEQIKEIDKLREQTQALLARKQVVETLQTNRTEAVHILDQVVRQLPDGIYLTSLKQTGTKVTVVGYAQSNARVSTLMRNIESSPWIEGPELVEIKSVPSPAAKELRVNEFTLSFKVKRAAPPESTKAAAGAPGAKPAAGAPGAKPTAAGTAPVPAAAQPAPAGQPPAPQGPQPAPASKKS